MRETAGAEVALINGGTIRTGIARGKIDVKDIYAVLPFDNYLVAIRLTGAQLKAALEHGVTRLEEPSGSFPQVSGLTFTYSRSAPAGSRVREVLVGARRLDPQKEYVVATNDYLVAGGDGYTAFGEALKSAGDYANLGGTLSSSKLAYRPRHLAAGPGDNHDPGPEKHRPGGGRAHQSRRLICGYMLMNNPWIWFPGMQVKHAVIGADQTAAIAAGLKVYDAWGHELGLDGASGRRHEDFCEIKY